MKIKFWGTRGSIPVPGFSTLKYGGNTPCVQFRISDTRHIIIDAGSGIRELGNELIKSDKPLNIDLFITHSHWDHIHGMTFFQPFFKKNTNVSLYFNTNGDLEVVDLLDHQMHSVFFPVTREVFQAKINYVDILPKQKLIIDGVTIESVLINHPGNTLSFKLTENNKSVVYMTDNEIRFNEEEDVYESILQNNRELIEFSKNADYLIHDTMYDNTEYKQKKGWGHSTYEHLLIFAHLAKVKTVVLFHYNPDYNDNMVDKMLEKSHQLIADLKMDLKCIASSENSEIIM